MKKFGVLIIMLFLVGSVLTGCAPGNSVEKAQTLIAEGNYTEAIDMLLELETDDPQKNVLIETSLEKVITQSDNESLKTILTSLNQKYTSADPVMEEIVKVIAQSLHTQESEAAVETLVAIEGLVDADLMDRILLGFFERDEYNTPLVALAQFSDPNSHSKIIQRVTIDMKDSILEATDILEASATLMSKYAKDFMANIMKKVISGASSISVVPDYEDTSGLRIKDNVIEMKKLKQEFNRKFTADALMPLDNELADAYQAYTKAMDMGISFFDNYRYANLLIEEIGQASTNYSKAVADFSEALIRLERTTKNLKTTN